MKVKKIRFWWEIENFGGNCISYCKFIDFSGKFEYFGELWRVQKRDIITPPFYNAGGQGHVC